MSKLSPFSNLAKFISKSPDNGPVSGEQLCMEDCKPLCRCGPDPCVCTVSPNKDGPNEYKENGSPPENWAPEKCAFDNLAYEPIGHNGLKRNLGHQFAVKESEVKIRVQGMTCQSCVRSIEERIGSIEGVVGVQVSLSDKEASLMFNPVIVTPEVLRKHIEDMGFDASLLALQSQLHPSVGHCSEVTLGVEGMHCGSCVKNITETLSGVVGVNSVFVSLEKGSLDLRFDPSLLTLETVKGLLEEIPPGNFMVSIPGWNSRLNSASIPPQTVTIGIEGMTCNSCVQAIEGTVSQRAIKVNLQEKKGIVTFDSSLTSSEELRAAIEDMGFEAWMDQDSGVYDVSSSSQMSSVLKQSHTSKSSPIEITRDNPHGSEDRETCKCFVHVTGMTCASCVANIEKNLLKHKGIKSVFVALMAGKAEVKYDPGLLDAAQIVQLISHLGFGASVMEENTVQDGVLDLSVSVWVHLRVFQ